MAAGGQGARTQLSDSALLVFARHDSRRLPGKVLMEIGGRPMLGRVIDRLRLVPGARPIVVATSDRPLDDPVAAYAEGEGVGVFRGAAEDVAARALACAEANGLASFARISGDSPFIDPGLVARLIALREAKGLDLATNVFPRSFPAGTSVEVLTSAALRRACAKMTEADDREHVTRYIYRNPDQFRICNFAAADPGYARIGLAVDSPADLARAIWIAEHVHGPVEEASLEDVVALAAAWEAPGQAGANPEASTSV